MQENSQALETLVAKIVRPGQHNKGRSTPAIVQMHKGGEREVSYEEFETLIDKSQAALAGLGIGHKDKVIIIAPNSPETFATILASWRLGALAIPVDFRMTAQELVNIARKLEVKAVVAMPAIFKDFLQFVENELGEAHIKLADMEAIIEKAEAAKVNRQAIHETAFESLKEPAFLILTSGTTGTPKGALHDLGSLVSNLKELSEMAGIDDKSKIVVPVPLSHVLGLEVSLAALLNACTVIMSEMSMEGIIIANNKFKPNFLVGVPTIYAALASIGPSKVNLENARVLLCGGAPLPPSLAEDFEKAFKRRVNNGYGSTESKIIAVNLDGPMESVGKIVPSCQIKIVDENGAEKPEGEEGEIVICGPMLMLGYIGNEEATAKVMKDRCYKTGDIGRMQDGYLFVMGRNKEMIIVAGNKVFPSEVEDVLRQCPIVKEVAIVGVPNSKLGQIVKAHIVITDKSKHAEESKDELKASMKEFCAANLKRELRPMEWSFYDESQSLPKTLSGKIDKKLLN